MNWNVKHSYFLQANERVLAPAIQIERPIEVFMQTIQQQAQNLKRVADYRVENGIIVIDA